MSLQAVKHVSVLISGSENGLPSHSRQRLQHFRLAELCRTCCRRQTGLHRSEGRDSAACDVDVLLVWTILKSSVWEKTLLRWMWSLPYCPFIQSCVNN